MASVAQSLPRSLSATTITTIITTILLATNIASLQAQKDVTQVHQGCSFHPHVRLVSCRSVNVSILQEFLYELTTSTASTTPQPPHNATTTITSNTIPPVTTTTINTTTTTTLQATNTTIAAAAESEAVVGGDSRNVSGSARRESSRVTELSCVGCQIPRVKPTLLGDTSRLPISLERLTIVDSRVEEVLPDALTTHASTLVHLDLSYNLLQAIPKDVVGLTRLQVLDLRHNVIHSVGGSTQQGLSSMSSLRYIYLDHNKLGKVDQESPASLLPLWASVIESPPSHLTHLGLSFNNIKEVPNKAFSRLTNLVHLDLSNNLVTSLHRPDLPASLLNLDLAGNPWNCTCEATWILGLQRDPSHPTTHLPSTTTNTTTTTTTTSSPTLIPPTCFSPLRLRRRQLSSLTAGEVCPSQEETGADRVVYIGDDVEGPLREAFRAVRLLNVTSLTTHALLVSWRIDAAFYSLSDLQFQPLSWAVTMRDVTQDTRQAHVTRLSLDRYRREQPQWVPVDGLFAEVLEGLEVNTAYVICLSVVQEHHLYTRPSHCLHGTTLVMPQPVVSTAAPTSEALQSYSTQDYDIRTEAFSVWSESRSASLSWNVTVLPKKGRFGALVSREMFLRRLGWRVTFRPSAGNGEEEEEEEDEVVLVSHGGEPFQNFTNHYSIDGLQAGTRYTFCLHTLTEEEVKKSLTDDKSEKPLQEESPSHPTNPLPWEAHSHTLPTTARGRNGVDFKGDASGQNLEIHNNAFPAVLPPSPPNKVAPPAHSTPGSRTSVSVAGGNSPTIVPVTPRTQGPAYNFPPQPPSTSASSNFPPIPPSLPQVPRTRPPRPPRPQSGGGFVYTSTGKRIPVPSGPSVLLPPFSVPPPIPIRNPGPPQDRPSLPSRQGFIYEFDKPSAVPPPPPLSSPSDSRRQTFTYQERRRRAVVERRPSPLKAMPLCRQIVTPAELDMVLPAAIAATISCAITVVVVLIVCCCCWPRICCRRKRAWRSRTSLDSRKVSTISAPSPVNMFSGHTSMAAGVGTRRNDGDGTGSRREISEDSKRAGRSISTTSSSGYLTPLQSTNDNGPQNQKSDPQAAYFSLMQSRLLQKHKDLPDFHPGYDIPPTASNKTLVGYDYPHPTPVNSIGSVGDRLRPPATSLPSPSSSDSNYNVSIGNSSEPDRNPTEVNLNLPSRQLKSSGLTKSVHVAPDVTDTSNYIFPPADAPAMKASRTYLRNPPTKTRHRRIGQTQQGTEEHNNILDTLSPSMPDLTTAAADTKTEGELAPKSRYSLNQPASLPPTASVVEDNDASLNLPTVHKDKDLNKQQEQPVSGGGISNKEREAFHTWGHPAKARPGVGDVILSGGTLIEVPEGYVVPKSPKPTPFIRLLVRGQSGPNDPAITTPPLSLSSQGNNTGSSRVPESGGSETRPTLKKDNNRLVINTATVVL